MERNFRTLRNRFLNILDTAEITSLELLNQKLFEYIRQHNTTVHSATGETPAERYRRDLDVVKAPQSSQWPDECFMNRISRRMKNDATVTIDKVLYDVPVQFIRSRVQIRYLPDDMEHAYIYHDNEKYFIRRTNKVENGRTKRINAYAIDYGGENPGV